VLARAAGAGAGWWFVLRDDAGGRETDGLLLGSVETAEHEAAAGADVVVTPAGDDERELARAVTDEIGLFEVDLGGHEGPVVVRATQADQRAATVVAVSPDSLTTGVRLVIGPPGTGVVEGQVLPASGTGADAGAGGGGFGDPAGTGDPAEAGPFGSGSEGSGTGTGAAGAVEGGIVEARFVETGRTDVITLGADARFRFDALPLDGDLILVATTGGGAHQGLAATVVSESLTSNIADITLRSPADPAGANRVDEPEIVTDDLDDWVIDGPVTVVPAEELAPGSDATGG
jgi:hypothetical protein